MQNIMFDFFKSFTSTNPNLQGAFDINNLNNIDYNKVTEMTKSNIDNFTKISKTSTEKVQSSMKNCVDSFQKNSNETFNRNKEAVLSGDSQKLFESQKDYIKSNVESNLDCISTILGVYSTTALNLLDSFKNTYVEGVESLFSPMAKQETK